MDAPFNDSNEVYKELFNLSLDLLCVASVDGYFKIVNPAFENTLGWTREELVTKPFLDYVHPYDKASTMEEIAKLAHGIAAVHFENRYLCKDGSFKWLSWSSSPSKGGLLYATAHDITQQKELIEHLQNQTKLLEGNSERIRELEAEITRLRPPHGKSMDDR
ncbi:PAS domain S-box protein [Candidatus Microgenomates bacterium]|nr:PAS domain S-box protein [Candidatus Microgenomates bacterium]